MKGRGDGVGEILKGDRSWLYEKIKKQDAKRVNHEHREIRSN